jgi:T5orf172 domain-containing protein
VKPSREKATLADAEGVVLCPTPELRHWRWVRRFPAAKGDGAIIELDVSLTYDDVHYSFFLLRQSLQVVQAQPVSFEAAVAAVERSGVNLAEGVWRPNDGMPAPIRPSRSSTDTTPGEVYFAQDSAYGSPIKIGFTSKGAAERVKQQRGVGNLRLLHAIPGTLADEAALHRRFERLKVSATGEWFYAESELCEHIRGLQRVARSPGRGPTTRCDEEAA